MGQPQVQIVVGGQRAEEFDLAGRQPGVAEQRQPRRQIHRPFAQPRQRGLVPDVRRVGVDALGQRPPQVGLPAQVIVEVPTGAVGGSAIEPVDEHLRPLFRVGGEQAGETPSHGIPPATAELGFIGVLVEMAQMCCQRAAPVLVADWRRSPPTVARSWPPATRGRRRWCR